VEWSPDQRRVLSASHDRTARLWDVDAGHCLWVFEGHTAGVVNAKLSADGRRAYSCDWNAGVCVWDVAD
jgi:WD40 repeat protein